MIRWVTQYDDDTKKRHVEDLDQWLLHKQRSQGFEGGGAGAIDVRTMLDLRLLAEPRLSHRVLLAEEKLLDEDLLIARLVDECCRGKWNHEWSASERAHACLRKAGEGRWSGRGGRAVFERESTHL